MRGCLSIYPVVYQNGTSLWIASLGLLLEEKLPKVTKGVFSILDRHKLEINSNYLEGKGMCIA